MGPLGAKRVGPLRAKVHEEFGCQAMIRRVSAAAPPTISAAPHGSGCARRIIDLLADLQRRTGDPRHRSVAGIVPLRQRISDTLAV